jgi:hypothetical protein
MIRGRLHPLIEMTCAGSSEGSVRWFRPLHPACDELGLNACVLLEMYVLPVLGSGADADNGMAHLVTFIHSYTFLQVANLT